MSFREPLNRESTINGEFFKFSIPWWIQDDIQNEIKRQYDLIESGKFEKNCFTEDDFLLNASILGEEMGEIHRAILEKDWEGLRTEIIQLIACGCEWVKGMDFRALVKDQENTKFIVDLPGFDTLVEGVKYD